MMERHKVKRLANRAIERDLFSEEKEIYDRADKASMALARGDYDWAELNYYADREIEYQSLH